MAKDDYYVIVYQILAYLYQCLKNDRKVDPEDLKPKKLYDIKPGYWLYILTHMQEDGLIERLEKKEWIDGEREIALERCQITPKGIGYLLDNNLMEKAKNFLQDAKSIIPFA